MTSIPLIIAYSFHPAVRLFQGSQAYACPSLAPLGCLSRAGKPAHNPWGLSFETSRLDMALTTTTRQVTISSECKLKHIKMWTTPVYTE
jgi:hypothetical protein